jgi:hypothetical protein
MKSLAATVASFFLLVSAASAQSDQMITVSRAGSQVLVIVSIHLGLRWPMIMVVARNLFGIANASAVHTLVLRVIAVAIAIQGVLSSFELDVGTKRSMQLTLDRWNFEESVSASFLHCEMNLVAKI